jgi:hypothetical protein
MRKFMIVLATLLVVCSCKKNDGEKPKDPEVPSNKNIELITTSAVPGELIIAKANFKLNTDTLSVFIGGKRVMAGVTDSSEIIFVLPALPQGTATIDYKNSGVAKSFSVSVGAYTPITQPDGILNTFNTRLDQIITEFDKYETNPNIKLPVEHGDLLSYLKQVQLTNFASLSAQEKLDLAYFMQANMPNVEEYKLDTLNTSFYARMQSGEASPSERILRAAGKYAASVSSAKFYLVIGIVLIVVPEPTFITKGMATAYITKGLIDLDRAFGLIDEIVNLLGIGIGVVETGRINDLLGGELMLVKDINKEVTVKASHRTIIASDISSTNAFINGVFKTKADADQIYSKTLTAINKIKSWFGGNPPQMPTNTGNFNASSSLKVFPLLGRGITIDQISNSAINVTVVNNLLSIILKATSATITAETPFTFRVNYTDPYTGISFNKTVNAIYKPVSYKLGLNLVNTTPVSSDPIVFGNDDGKFFVVLNEDNSPAINIDYTKISVATITNPNITAKVQLGGSGLYGSFLLTLHSNQTSVQTTSLDVFYQSQKIQTINASVNDSIEIYKANMIGDWTIETHFGINPDGWDLAQKQYITFDAAGNIYLNSYQDYGPPGSPLPAPSTFNPPHRKGNWTIVHNSTGYCFRDEAGKISERLTYPPSSFWLNGSIKYVR